MAVACPSSEAAAGRSPKWWRRSGRACWPSHDAAGFADSIEHLAQDGRLRQEMGHRAVERVRRNFTVDRDVERTLDMYALLGG